MNIESVRRDVVRFGWPTTLLARGLSTLGRAADFHVLRVLAVERPHVATPLPPRRYTHGFLGEGVLRRFAQDPTSQMSAAFLDQALSRGDRCFAILDGDVLASFSWYSRRRTPMVYGLVVNAGARFVYAYNVYTRPQYRGRRLHAIGAARALEALRAEAGDAVAGLVSCVDAANLTSLRSHDHTGYHELGACSVLCAGGRTFVHVDASIRRRGVLIERALPGEGPPASVRRGGAARREAA
jgi:hypothetical protein